MHTRKKSFDIRQIKANLATRFANEAFDGRRVEYEVDCPEGEGWELINSKWSMGRFWLVIPPAYRHGCGDVVSEVREIRGQLIPRAIARDGKTAVPHASVSLYAHPKILFPGQNRSPVTKFLSSLLNANSASLPLCCSSAYCWR